MPKDTVQNIFRKVLILVRIMPMTFLDKNLTAQFCLILPSWCRLAMFAMVTLSLGNLL